MHAIDLATLASTIVGCAPSLLAISKPMRPHAFEQFWLTCRFRHENWTDKLAAHRHAIQNQGVSHRNRSWHEIVPVIQEVLLSEPLLRCVAYLARLLEERAVDHEFSCLARNALAIQIEARHRCLHLIVFGQGLSVETAVKLNRLRRTLESYSDELLSMLPPVQAMDDYCFDSPSVRQSQAVLGHNHHWQNHQFMLMIHMMSEGLKRATATDIDRRIPNIRLNLKLSQAVLGMLPEAMFDPFGLPKSARRLAYQSESLESTGQTNDLTQPLTHPLNVLLTPSRQLVKSPKTNPRF